MTCVHSWVISPVALRALVTPSWDGDEEGQAGNPVQVVLSRSRWMYAPSQYSPEILSTVLLQFFNRRV